MPVTITVATRATTAALRSRTWWGRGIGEKPRRIRGAHIHQDCRHNRCGRAARLISGSEKRSGSARTKVSFCVGSHNTDQEFAEKEPSVLGELQECRGLALPVCVLPKFTGVSAAAAR